MIDWTDEQLEEYGIDKTKLKSILRRLKSIGKDMDQLNLRAYACDGTLILFHSDRPTHINHGEADKECVVAWPDVPSKVFDGGDW